MKINLSNDALYLLQECEAILTYDSVENPDMYLDIDIIRGDLVFLLTEYNEDRTIKREGTIAIEIVVDLIVEAENITIDDDFDKDDLYDLIYEWIQDNIDDKVDVLYSHFTYELASAVDNKDDIIVLESKENAGQYFIESGCFGDVSDSLLPYIDYDKLVDDIMIDGNLVEHNRTYYYYTN